ncbi:predicted protein [Naegleria gruberi]|uniref:Predicted protein n=1 Tax=Naegleria gruberi TaxID=5762 RepID=D2VNI2_NAEGR|nr:uncharacterized protein NAEGRDRAFT_70509 [Naegleria gruberi]EFC41737.1 predicted protein [Naegleria gruberi]|eukprot:XP_002674481.1 predicted protein [Naegleria gruberi strain NEG-M]
MPNNTPRTIFFFTLLLLSLLTLVSASDFNVQYTTTSPFASYSFAGATTTSSCSLYVYINRTSTDPLTLTISNYATSAYSGRLNTLPYSLVGVSGLSYSVNSANNSATAAVDFTFTYICTNGMLNVRPQSMAIFTLNPSVSYYFKSTDAAASSGSTIGYTFTQNATSGSATIGFAAIVEDGKSTLGPFKNFFGPYQFNYQLRSNAFGQLVESMSYLLPNVWPNLNGYGFSIANAVYAYKTTGYSTLYAFSVTSLSNPNVYGASLQYSYASGNNFYDVNGNSVLIQKSTLACFCSADGNSYSKTTVSVTSTGLTCSNIPSSCQYLSIAAQTINAANSDPMSSATTLYSATYVNTGTLYSTKYYKISVPSGFTLTLKDINLFTSSSYSGYITINADSYYSSSEIYVYSTSQYSSLSYTNYYTNAKTVYVSVRPTSSSTTTNMEFIPYISNIYYFGWSYRLPVIITSAVVFPLFGLIAILVVVITIKRNSRRAQQV